MPRKHLHLIGDVHAGRRFLAGVPAHRRGEREAAQFQHFCEQLQVDCEYNVCVGDLYEAPQVPYRVMLDVAYAYLKAADARPDTTFVILAGNHDRSRSVKSVDVWDVFKAIAETRTNVFAVDRPTRIGAFAFLPWEWSRTALEQCEDFTPGAAVTHVIGHWDLIDYGGDTSHMVPAARLRELFPNAEIITGHYHVPGTYEVEGIEVTCTGSMLPYSHAEDPEGKTYVTLPLADVLADPEALKDKCVRVLLREGEELPPDLDCLALTAKRVEEETDAEEIDLDEFDWGAVLEDCLKDVTEPVREFIKERLVDAA